MNLKVLICLITVLVFSTLNGKAQVQTLDVTIDCADQVVDQIKCIKFKASSIDELTALSFTIVYDPTVLEFVDPPVVSSCLTNLAPSSFNNSTPGIITFIWFNDPINITSECELFSLCFKYIGQPGESSLISLNSIITYIEAVSE